MVTEHDNQRRYQHIHSHCEIVEVGGDSVGIVVLSEHKEMPTEATLMGTH